MPLPTPRIPDREETLAAPDGLPLHVEHFEPRGQERGLCVLVPGFSSHVGLYRHVGEALAARGLAVSMADCRGNGRSGGKRAFVRRFGEFTGDLHAVIGSARAAHPAGKLTLLGHSHGATICLDYLLGAGGAADALVLAAPWLKLRMKVPWWKEAMAPVIGAVWPSLPMANGLVPGNGCHDADVVALGDTDPLIHHVATPRWFNEVEAAQARIASAAAALAVPTLMLLAGDDRVVDAEVASAFAARVNDGHPGTVEIRRYEGLYHELFLEPERDRVIEDVGSWIVARGAV